VDATFTAHEQHGWDIHQDLGDHRGLGIVIAAHEGL
jgi:hypothetical protein